MIMFGERLKGLRKGRKLSQAELGKIFNMSESAIGMYERGERKPSLELVSKFADFFNIPSDYILGRTKNTTYKNPLDEKVDELMKDPETQVFFKDYMAAPEEKKAQARNFLKYLLQEEEKKSDNS